MFPEESEMRERSANTHPTSYGIVTWSVNETSQKELTGNMREIGWDCCSTQWHIVCSTEGRNTAMTSMVLGVHNVVRIASYIIKSEAEMPT
jgi:hypothetical protein